MEKQLDNARPIYWLCVVQSALIYRGFPPVAFARTDNSGRPILRLHALTLIVKRELAFTHNGLCVLARTIQFSKNRPTGRPRDARIPLPVHYRLASRPCLGEPSKVTRRKEILSTPRAI